MENINFNTLVPCFGKVIVDAKDIYTNYLLNILSPLIYEGIHNLYKKAGEYHIKSIEKQKIDKTYTDPGLNSLFQKLMMIFKDINNSNMYEETCRIRNNCQCADYFDDLIRAVIKANIMALTCNINNSNLVKNNNFHQTIDINLFTHKCYLESIKFLYEVPELFEVSDDTQIMSKNKQAILNYIKAGIKDAIKNILPMRIILTEFLENNFQQVYDNHMDNIKKVLIEENEKISREQAKHVNLLEGNDGNLDLDNYDYDLEDLIVNRKKEDTYEFINANTDGHESLLESTPTKNEEANSPQEIQNPANSDGNNYIENAQSTFNSKPQVFDVNEFFSNNKYAKYDTIMNSTNKQFQNPNNMGHMQGQGQNVPNFNNLNQGIKQPLPPIPYTNNVHHITEDENTENKFHEN